MNIYKAEGMGAVWREDGRQIM